MRLLIHDYAGHSFQVGLSRELARRGFEVVHAYAGGLLTPRGCLDRQDDDPAMLRFREVPMSGEYRRDKYRFLRRRQHELGYGRAFAAVIAEERPAVVISGNTPTEPQWLAIRQADRHRIPFVSWVQDYYSAAVRRLAARRSALIGWAAGTYYAYLDGRCLRRSAHAVTISEDFVPLLRRHGLASERISVIENWGALAEMPLRPKANTWSCARGLDRVRVLMYTGTLAMKHNPRLLLELARRFRPDPDVRVVVVSEGPGAEFLHRARERERLANLVLLPFQSFSEMPEVLGTADVLLALLEPDAGCFSVPSKVLTYLCAGRPTLAAMPASNLAARLLGREGTGVVVAPENVSAWLEAATQLVAQPDLRAGIGRAARAFAETHFDIRRVGDRFERVLRRAVASATPATNPVPEVAGAPRVPLRTPTGL